MPSASIDRSIFSALAYLEIDEQGRFVIPKNLLDYADLAREAVIIGVGDHFEIWSVNKWKKYNKKDAHASTFTKSD